MTFKLDLETILAAALVVMVVTGTPGASIVDCNGNGERDDRDIFYGTSEDCNGNGVPDECDLTAGTSQDCDASEIPDECELDCNGNGLHDSCDVESGFSDDCNANGVPDVCDTHVAFDPRPLDGNVAGYSSIGADIDSDGDLDVVTNQQIVIEGYVVPGTYWYENDGAGSFGAALSVHDDHWIGVLSSADLDNDGDADVVLNRNGRLYWYENLGGSFGSRHQVQPVPPFTGWTKPAVPADLDGDGDQDLLHLITDWAPPSSFVWYENIEGQTLFGPKRTIYTGDNIARFVDAADVDGDGDIDAVCGFEYEIMWYRNDGSGNFVSSTVDATVGAHSIFIDDIDGDGDADILVSIWANIGMLVWYENLDGDGTFGARKIISDVAPERIYGALADLDGDGDLDVAAASVHTDWYENLDGRGTFGPKTLMGEVYIFEYDVPFPADFDQDGDIDVLQGTASVLLENLSDNCNGNDLPDDCETDCNANGIVDECDLRSQSSMDCDYNAVPDECDAACSTCNADGDPCLDEQDCLPDDASIWSEPTVATQLRLWGGTLTSLSWQPPVSPGASPVVYSTLRSNSPADFLNDTLCLETNGDDTFSVDADEPTVGELFYYLVRVESECPGGAWAMGSSSSGVPRMGRECF